jgi:hypothetical protein
MTDIKFERYRIVGWRDWQALSIERLAYPSVDATLHRVSCSDCSLIRLYDDEDLALAEVGSHGC